MESRIKEWDRVAIETRQRRMDWVLVSRDQSSDQNHFVDKEVTLYSWDF